MLQGLTICEVRAVVWWVVEGCIRAVFREDLVAEQVAWEARGKVAGKVATSEGGSVEAVTVGDGEHQLPVGRCCLHTDPGTFHNG